MKKLFAFCIVFTFHYILHAQTTYIPNNNFEQALINLGLDTGSPNSYIPTANIDTLTVLDVSSLAITSLIGIEDFSSLEILKCHDNYILNLDISQNTALKEVWCQRNFLSALDVSSNPLLEVLVCSQNNLSSLNIMQNTSLKIVDLISNHVTSLNVSQNTLLEELWCGSNQLNQINVANNPGLKILWCKYNQIINLDVSSNPLLEILLCDGNNLSSLDVSSNPLLEQLHCIGNKLTSIDVTTNPLITQITCDSNQLTGIDLSNNIALNIFQCKNNNITSLDLSNNVNLYNFVCNENNLTSLNIKNGNNSNFYTFAATYNPNLNCINVDDPVYSNNNWSLKDQHCIFSSNCFPASIQSNINANKSSFYPNPAANFIYINSTENIAEVKIIDLTGKEYVTIINNNRVDISGLSTGVYFLETITQFGSSKEKIIKQ